MQQHLSIRLLHYSLPFSPKSLSVCTTARRPVRSVDLVVPAVFFLRTTADLTTQNRRDHSRLFVQIDGRNRCKTKISKLRESTGWLERAISRKMPPAFVVFWCEVGICLLLKEDSTTTTVGPRMWGMGKPGPFERSSTRSRGVSRRQTRPRFVTIATGYWQRWRLYGWRDQAVACSKHNRQKYLRNRPRKGSFPFISALRNPLLLKLVVVIVAAAAAGQRMCMSLPSSSQTLLLTYRQSSSMFRHRL